MTCTKNGTVPISSNVNAATIWQNKTIFREHKFATYDIINWNDVRNYAKNHYTCWQIVETERLVFSCAELMKTTTNDPSPSFWWVLFLHFRSSYFACARPLPKHTTHEITFQKGRFSPFPTVVGWNPTVQNRHSTLDLLFLEAEDSKTNAQADKTFSRRVAANLLLFMYRHIPGPMSLNNTQNSHLRGWILYDCAIQSNGLHRLQMSVLFVQWHVQGIYQ